MFKWFKRLIDSCVNHEQDLTKVYVLALSSVALLILVFQSVKFAGQNQQLEQVSTLRVVDKQIYRTERISNLLLEAQLTMDPVKLKKKIRSIQRKVRIAQKKNLIMNETIEGFECKSKKCEEFLYNNFLGENLERLARSKNTAKISLEEASQEIDRYQKFLIRVDGHLDDQINTSATGLITLDVLFAVLLIGVLFAQAFWVFRPAVNNMNEALEARSDFISRISHEIRNPMNSIMGMAEILKSSELKSDQRQNVDNLLRSSHVLLEMLNNLVDFSSTTNKQITLNPSKASLYKVIDKVIDVISIQAHDKGVEVYVDVDSNLSKKFLFDQVRLEQVLLNLLNNALKFTEKGSITLKVEELKSDAKSSDLKFSIIDTGIGISKDKLIVIFESFVQEDSSVKRRFGGSGLGLSICKEIASLMETHIHVDSEKGVGSTFSFDLRLEKEESVTPYILKNSKPRVYYFCGQNSKSSIESYLKKFTSDFKIFTDSSSINKIKEKDFKHAEFIVDDSIGVVEMAKVFTDVNKHGKNIQPYALLRSNFSKENMELLRKEGFRQFLIKPFRAWHLQAEENDFFNWIEDKNRDFDISQISEDKPTQGLKVLAVDDSKDNLYLIEAILKSSVDHIVLAEKGLEAVEKIKKESFDLVFMDIQMPVMDGYTAIKKIRSFDKELPVYAVTAHASLVEEKKCLEAGFNGRITKPINRKIILSKVQTLSKNKKQDIAETDNFESRMIKKLLPAYFEERARDLVKLEAAIATDNLDTFKRIGHKIKGSAKSYGFAEIGEEGAKLEQAAIDQKIDLCKNLSKSITLEIQKEKLLFESSS
jgi:signal transduction histidine kinase/CheY-like chemotaxis protein